MKKEFVIPRAFSKDYPVIETEISDLIQAHSEYELKWKEKFWKYVSLCSTCTTD